MTTIEWSIGNDGMEYRPYTPPLYPVFAYFALSGIPPTALSGSIIHNCYSYDAVGGNKYALGIYTDVST